MRRFIWTVFLLILPGIASADDDAFCNGFERGYSLGYKRASDSAFDPFIPFCPFQPLKRFSDPEGDYEHGMILGIEQGILEGASGGQ